jgi:serine/threonine-protein kinase
MRDLLSQTTSDDGAEPQTREGRYLPVAYRYPWLQELALRGGTAVACAGAAVPLANAALAAHPSWVVPTLVGCAALSALAPCSGGAVFVALLVVALFGEGTAGVMFPALTLIAFVAWWWSSGRGDRTSGLVVLAPCLLPSPMASAPLAAFCMPPARAAASSVVGLLLSLLANQAMAAGFAAYPTATALLSTLVSPGTWVTVAGCACAAWAGAAVSRHGGSTRWGYAGQAVCCLIILGTQALRARVENGDIWTASTAVALGIAVLLGVLMCTATSLRGPRQVDGGVEE